ncbi:hypothetical protein QBZ16_004664 [Prototheca wickerhamii]|uniref:RCC1-like domain-containing protein n=1 Tax=Prototheca wickerhamii TaxID=3111 RepID=A0AAD9IHN6_PROWI|nr:hypothetical protein QBZ16_004664 [Prototheca wickerhamii]
MAPRASRRKAPEIKATKKRAIKQATVLEPVTHATHGKVPAQLFVFGDGDCGQLGLAGELWEKSGLLASTSGAAAADPYLPGRVSFGSDVAIVQLSAGDSHTAALSSTGEVWAWGTYRDASGVYGFAPGTRIALEPRAVYSPRASGDQVVRIVSGADHVVALTRGGAVLTWGTGQQGQLARTGERLGERVKEATLLLPAPVLLHGRGKRGVRPRVVDVAAASYATFLILDSGAVMAAGLNNYGQLGIEGDYDRMLFKLEDVPELAKNWRVTQIRGGQHHSLAVATPRADEGAAADGASPKPRGPAQLWPAHKAADVGADSACPAPRQVDGLEGCAVAGAAAGIAVSGVYSSDGDAWLWGFGTNNQLGKGDDDSDEVLPKKLAITKRLVGQKIVALEFGGQHAAMLVVPKPEEDGKA